LCPNEVLYIHGEFENAAKLSKEKELHKIVEEQAAALPAQAVSFHYQRRVCVGHYLQQTINIINDQPGILGPKLPTILLTLSLAKNEIFWFLIHMKRPLKNMRYKEGDWTDPLFASFLFFTEKLIGMLVEHEMIVRRYYLEFLINFDGPKLTSLVEKFGNISSVELRLLNAFCRRLSQLSDCGPTKQLGYEGWQLDHLRFQVLLAESSCPTEIVEDKELLKALSTSTFHFSLVDEFHHSLNQTTNLKELFNYRVFLCKAKLPPFPLYPPAPALCVPL
jgi:hypothetical protein